MITEITDNHLAAERRGWVLYDGACGRCTTWARRLEGGLRRRGYGVAPLQSPWVRRKTRLPDSQLLEEMRVLTPDGRQIGGADAVLHIAGLLWWARPLALLARLPGGTALLRRGYRWLAARRCTGGTCGAAASTERWERSV